MAGNFVAVAKTWCLNAKLRIEVSINVGTPKWMIYSGKSNKNWWFGVTHGYPHFRKTPYSLWGPSIQNDMLNSWLLQHLVLSLCRMSTSKEFMFHLCRLPCFLSHTQIIPNVTNLENCQKWVSEIWVYPSKLAIFLGATEARPLHGSAGSERSFRPWITVVGSKPLSCCPATVQMGSATGDININISIIKIGSWPVFPMLPRNTPTERYLTPTKR